jgi:subtilisin family serine protease
MAGQKKAGPPLTVNQSLDHLTAYVSVRSLGGLSLFSGAAKINADTVKNYLSTEKDTHICCGKLQELGFEIERVGPLSVRISGPGKLFAKHMGVKFEKQSPASLESIPLGAGPKVKAAAWQVPAAPWTPTQESLANLLHAGISETIEGIVFPEPVALHAPKSTPPTGLGYHYLRPPTDLVKHLNATPVHKKKILGQNVRAAMIDSGFQWSHPYFKKKKYNVKVSLPEDSDADANGHGTGESANLLALAPRVRLHGLAMSDIVRAFQVARDSLRVQIISNSWGSRLDTDGPNGYWHPYWSLVQAEIALCVSQGIVVVFSGGNGGMSFTASMPETISVGGVHVRKDKTREASNYASSFRSTRFPGQRVPDVCGLVGMQPSAIYIALPIPSGCEIDRDLAGPSYPNQDKTSKMDGWGVFSGTSAACPQVAGVIALILSKHPGADLAEIRQRLARAVDVTTGQSAMGDVAGPGPDDATGAGLVDAEEACK